MQRNMGRWVLSATVAMSVLAGGAAAQPAAVQVTGAELEAWFAADQAALAGVNVINNCHYIAKGSFAARSQAVFCPNAQPFIVTGEARVQGNQLCSKFVYPDGARLDACQDIFKVGENKYEGRLNGSPRSFFYRLIR